MENPVEVVITPPEELAVITPDDPIIGTILAVYAS